MANLIITGSINFSGDPRPLSNTTEISFTGPLEKTATFLASQFGGSLISNTVQINPSSGADRIVVNGILGTFSAAGWTVGFTAPNDFITLNGGKVGDSITGSGARDVLNGLIGNDTLAGGLGADTVNGGSGDDRLVLSAADGSGDVLDGGDGFDTLALRGGAEVGVGFGVTLTGVERILFDGATIGTFDPDQIDAASGVVEVQGSALAEELRVSAVNLDLSHLNFVNWTGGVDVVRISAIGFGGTVVGSDVADTITVKGAFGEGFASVDGGGGDDRMLFSGPNLGVIAKGGAGLDRVVTTSSVVDLTGASLIGIEAVEVGQEAILSAAQVAGGLSTFIGTPGNDRVFVKVVAGIVTDLRGVAVQSWEPTDRIEVLGSDFDDRIFGSAELDNLRSADGNDTLTGGAGNDFLSGGDDDDVLDGGVGGDFLVGDDGIDTADYSGSSEGVSADLDTGFATGGDASGDSLIGMENITGSGKADSLLGDADGNVLKGGRGGDLLAGFVGGDTLVGGGGKDSLDGGTGSDTLVGGKGKDLLTGGDDSDFFVFVSPDDSKAGATRDVITDFVTGQDRIDVSAIASGDADGAFVFNVGPVFRGAGEIRAEARGGDTLVLFNTDADADAEFSILLTGNVFLSEAHFIL